MQFLAEFLLKQFFESEPIPSNMWRNRVKKLLEVPISSLLLTTLKYYGTLVTEKNGCFLAYFAHHRQEVIKIIVNGVTWWAK
jgi:hypothetical protein